MYLAAGEGWLPIRMAGIEQQTQHVTMAPCVVWIAGGLPHCGMFVGLCDYSQ